MSERELMIEIEEVFSKQSVWDKHGPGTVAWDGMRKTAEWMGNSSGAIEDLWIAWSEVLLERPAQIDFDF